MLKKITNRYNARQEMKAFINEADRMIEQYGWSERTVMPYGFAMKVTKIISDCKDYDICTAGSKETLILLANGLVDIMNSWEADHNAPKVTIRQKKTGKTYTINADMADMFQNDEFEIVA